MTEQPYERSGPDSNPDIEGSAETVGAGDVEADAARSGAPADLEYAPRDDAGEPVGPADVQADAARSGADPHAV
jgi:hypothetical protein